MNLPGSQCYEVNYIQPKEIFRSKCDPVLSGVAGPIVVKTSWQEISRRGNEAAMYCASNGRFGTVPHVCSYEGMSQHREVTSNILFLPRQEDITKHHWPIFGGNPPIKPDLRTLWFTIFSVEGQSLVQAKRPRQLSRAWVHFILGTSVTTFRCTLRPTQVPCRMVIDIPVWIPAPGPQHWERSHDDESCEEEGIRGA